MHRIMVSERVNSPPQRSIASPISFKKGIRLSSGIAQQRDIILCAERPFAIIELAGYVGKAVLRQGIGPFQALFLGLPPLDFRIDLGLWTSEKPAVSVIYPLHGLMDVRMLRRGKGLYGKPREHAVAFQKPEHLRQPDFRRDPMKGGGGINQVIGIFVQPDAFKIPVDHRKTLERGELFP